MLKRMKILLLLCGVAGLALVFPACSSDDDPTDPGGGGDPGDSTAPQVTAANPSDGQMMVDIASQVLFTFDEAMDPDSATGQVSMSHGTVTGLNWNDEMNLVVDHDGWPMGTQVSVTLDTGIADVAGNNLKSPTTVTFWTMTDQPALLDFSPDDGAVGVNRATSIELFFSHSMNVATLESGITISDNTKAVHPFTVENVDGYRFELNPVDPLASMELTTVTLSTDVQSTGGDNLPAPISFSFTTSDVVDVTPPTIVSMDPPSGSTMPGDQTDFTLVFSEPMDTENFAPTMMNGQFAWLISQTLGSISWNPEGTQLTVPLPVDLPAGLPLMVRFAGYADANGNVQPNETVWTCTIAGTASPYPVSEGYRWEAYGTWAEGLPGNNNPTNQGEDSVFYEFSARGMADQWERKEYLDPSYSVLDYYEILSVTGAGVDIVGFAEEDEGSFTEFFLTSPLTLVEFPYSTGNTWSRNATVTLPDVTFNVTMAGEVMGQEDLPLFTGGGDFEIIWTDVWKVNVDVTLKVSGETMSEEESVYWLVPGVGVVRETYREDRVHQLNDPGWFETERWLFVDLN